jgi:hypothetical protein
LRSWGKMSGQREWQGCDHESLRSTAK